MTYQSDVFPIPAHVPIMGTPPKDYRPLSDGETLRLWQEATGRDAPGAPVPVGLSCTVGRMTVRLECVPPPATLRALLAGKGPAKRTPRAAMFSTFGPLSSNPDRRRSRIAEYQTAAYRRAMEMGCWS